jgi:hypothetical protein
MIKSSAAIGLYFQAQLTSWSAVYLFQFGVRRQSEVATALFVLKAVSPLPLCHRSPKAANRFAT